MLRCIQHGHRFTVRNAVADLLRPQYADVIERLSDSKATRAADVEGAAAWLVETLGVNADIASLRSSDRVLHKLLAQVSTLLALARTMRLDPDDIRELYAILAGEAMSAGYRRHVADPARASKEAVNYEKYEDILLRKVVTGTLAQSDSVAIIELGSGPGRLLHQYGSTMSDNRDACDIYRTFFPHLYRPDNLRDHQRIRLVLGVDFAQDMLQAASKWLVQDRLGDLVSTGRLAQIRATVRELPIDFGDSEWRGTTRVACILFQTLGNQLSRDLQVQMLRSARKCVGERGVVFVSVFNAESFADQGAPYYESIDGSVGATWALEERAFLSKLGVYSRWLFPDELRALLAEAGMEEASVLAEADLKVYPDYDQYIETDRQERYKKRALIGIYAPGLDLNLD